MIGRRTMSPKFRFLYLFTSFIPFVISQAQTSETVNICYNSSLEGFRLKTTELKTKVVSEWIDCVMDCAIEFCCRSINFKKTLTLQNEPNCEMLHNVVYNISEKVLEINSSYDHVYLVNPQKEYNASCIPKISKDRIKECKSSKPLGMEDNSIRDSQITASSEYDRNHRASNARLNFKAGNGRRGAWSAKRNDLNQWLQIDFQRSTVITGISTQGRNGESYTQLVKRYTISFSNDRKDFKKFKAQETVKEFQGNNDKNSIVHHNITSSPITTRFIRVHPTAWQKHISMRVEFYGCSY